MVTLSSEGVLQTGWLGAHFLAWKDVKDVKFEYQQLTLTGPQIQVDLPLVFFYNTDAAVNFVIAHLPDNMQKQLN